MENKSRKSQKNRVIDFQKVATDITSDIKSDTVVSGEECLQVDGDFQKGKDLKKKKKKSKCSQGFEVDCPLTQETVTANLSDEDKSKRKKRKKDRHGESVPDRIFDVEVMKEIGGRKKRKSKVNFEEIIAEMGGGEESIGNKKTSREDKVGKKSKREKKNDDGVGESMLSSEGENVEKVEKKKQKRKREKQQENGNLGTGLQETLVEDYGKEGSVLAQRELRDGETDDQSTLSKTISDQDKVNSKGKKEKKTNAAENSTADPNTKKKSKKVNFSSDVEVFPSIVRGKRFSKEEDEIIKDSVLNYVKTHDLGDKGVDMVMQCKSHPEIKGCWKKIGAALPYHPSLSIYKRAHILFERSDTRKWTEEDIEYVKNAQKKHGNKWKAIADEIGRFQFHVRDIWRGINNKKGHWSQEEYQNLYDMVNIDLRMKLHVEEKKSKHGMLRDNIPWTAISEKLSTRNVSLCCKKWYNQLTSSLAAEGLWAHADDYRLVGALYEMDASCEGDVDWDNLLEHRSGDVCRKRWNQMVLHIGYHRSKPFTEQVETLAQRYRPDLAEAREAWDSMHITT